MARTLRIAVAGLVLLAAVISLALGWLLFLWLFDEDVAVAILATAACAPFVAWLLIAGRWAASRSGRVAQGVAVLVTVGFYASIAVVLAREALHDAGARDTLGTSTAAAAGGFVVAAVAATLAAIVVAAVPAAGRRRIPIALVAAVMGAGALAAGGGAVAVSQDAECEQFRFDRDRWLAASAVDEEHGEYSDAEAIADAVVRCGTFDGATRAEVRRELGRGGRPHARTWRYLVGWTNDGIGVGDAQEMYVDFGRDDRVDGVELLYD